MASGVLEGGCQERWAAFMVKHQVQCYEQWLDVGYWGLVIFLLNCYNIEMAVQGMSNCNVCPKWQVQRSYHPQLTLRGLWLNVIWERPSQWQWASPHFPPPCLQVLHILQPQKHSETDSKWPSTLLQVLHFPDRDGEDPLWNIHPSHWYLQQGFCTTQLPLQCH